LIATVPAPKISKRNVFFTRKRFQKFLLENGRQLIMKMNQKEK
jgi:hypothetical protein